MSVTVYDTPARGARNGLPEFRPYRYQGDGTDTLTPEIDAMPLELFTVRGRSHHPLVGREPAVHGSDGGARRHYREKTPLCEACKQHETRRSAERAAADVASGKTVRAVHAPNRGRPWCGAMPSIGEPVIAAPGQEVTCRRCVKAMGRKP